MTLSQAQNDYFDTSQNDSTPFSEIPMKDILNFAGEHPFVFSFALIVTACLISEIFQSFLRLVK